MKIVMVGDIHGEFKSLNKIIRRAKADVVIQLGDNGYYWGKNPKENANKIEPLNSKVYMLPGNHENWVRFEEEVGRHGKDPVEVEPNIFMCPIGSTIEVNGKNILFVGGAISIDKKYRLPYITWWPEETLDQKDLDYIKKNHKGKEFDIVCSHTCPNKFNVMEGWEGMSKMEDSTTYILNEVLRIFKPEFWYFGHYHRYKKDYHVIKDASSKKLNVLTEWYCLDMTNHPSDKSGKIEKNSYKIIEINDIIDEGSLSTIKDN